MKILCIIDVQEMYAHPEPFDQIIIQQIERAKRDGYSIVLVEMSRSAGYSNDPLDTIPTILKALEGAPFTPVFKYAMDGSEKILTRLEREITEVDVVGLFTDQCVASTVKGLRERLSPEKVNVIPEATWPFPWHEGLIEENLRQTPKQEIPKQETLK